MLLNCGAREDSSESLGQQGDQTSQSESQISTEYSLEGLMLKLKTPILWPPDVKSQLTGKDPDAGKDWGQEEKRAREWDGWMASPNQWTWVWANSSRQWWTGKPEVLQSMGSQRVWHNLVTEQQHDNSHEPRSHNWQLVRPSSEWARIHICHSSITSCHWQMEKEWFIWR